MVFRYLELVWLENVGWFCWHDQLFWNNWFHSVDGMMGVDVISFSVYKISSLLYR